MVKATLFFSFKMEGKEKCAVVQLTNRWSKFGLKKSTPFTKLNRANWFELKLIYITLYRYIKKQII